ncbi:MAG: site-specific integrase [Proteobacteria bacterium]|nr:MAG: site-specific integrase [Pseudomonadota bacterium]
MAIREKQIDGKKEFEVSYGLRSKLNPSIRSQRIKKGIKTLREAQTIEKGFIRECAEELAYKENRGVPWSDILERFELAQRENRIGIRTVQKNILQEILSALRKFTGSWMHLLVQEISAGDVRKVFQEMQDQGYSRSRLRAVKWGINLIYRWGIEEGEIKGVNFSPAQHVVLNMPKDEKPPAILTAGEIEHLLDEARACQHEWYPVWVMALNTGMRSGELYALEWSDIDLENKLITVSKSWNNRMKITKSTKAGYWRKVPVNNELETLLRELRVTGAGDSKFVLPRLSRWGNGEAAKFLRDFCVQIGITPVHFHALRACFATHLLNAGVSSPIVKKICGWTEEKVMNRYIRLAGVDVAGATESLGFGRLASLPRESRVVNLRDVRITGSRDRR